MTHTKEEILEAYYKYCTSVWPDDASFDDDEHFCEHCSLKLYCEKNAILKNASDKDFEWLENFLIKHSYLKHEKGAQQMNKDKIELLFAFQVRSCGLDCDICPFYRLCNLDYSEWVDEDFEDLKKRLNDNHITIYDYEEIPNEYINCINNKDYFRAFDIAAYWGKKESALIEENKMAENDKSNAYESVNAPAHYNGTECIENMEKIFGTVAVKHFCVLNAYKYLYRAGKKPDTDAEQDKAKAAWYLDYVGKLVKKDNAEYF